MAPSRPIAVAGHDISGTTPELPWRGENDSFEKVEYAEKFVSEIPHTTFIRIPDADHIPTENAPDRIARALAEFFAT